MTDRPQNPNLARFLEAVQKLGPLLDRVVFVGGGVTGLLITDPAAPPVRPTLDIDAMVEIGSYAELTVLGNRLKELGFCESREMICRWTNADLILDLIPTDASILGFTNRWYRPAMEQAQRIRVGEHDARLITAPYFLATKLEAFRGRGNEDYRTSHDLEDIVTVIDGRSEIVEEVRGASQELRSYLSAEFRALSSNRSFLDSLSGYLPPDAVSQARYGLVLDRMRAMVFED